MGTSEKKGGDVMRFLMKNKKKTLLIFCAAVGVLLLILGTRSTGESGKSAETAESGQTLSELTAYRERLEEEVAHLCASVSGVSQVEVLITLERGNSISYVRDKNGDPVTSGTGSARSALPESLRPPAVAGVGIVCRGGKDPDVVRILTDLVATSLNISTNRVFVTGK